ncbi:MAG: hypothetical protein QGH66_02945 [Dehalococcoidia bacterium]|nr:hypothetical protein [Dehalococcoidia bacterium]MDP7470044.1 hypothetical protein [Dehalococcoidia bacterium]
MATFAAFFIIMYVLGYLFAKLLFPFTPILVHHTVDQYSIP